MVTRNFDTYYRFVGNDRLEQIVKAAVKKAEVSKSHVSKSQDSILDIYNFDPGQPKKNDVKDLHIVSIDAGDTKDRKYAEPTKKPLKIVKHGADIKNRELHRAHIYIRKFYSNINYDPDINAFGVPNSNDAKLTEDLAKIFKFLDYFVTHKDAELDLDFKEEADRTLKEWLSPVDQFSNDLSEAQKINIDAVKKLIDKTDLDSDTALIVFNSIPDLMYLVKNKEDALTLHQIALKLFSKVDITKIVKDNLVKSLPLLIFSPGEENYQESVALCKHILDQRKDLDLATKLDFVNNQPGFDNYLKFALAQAADNLFTIVQARENYELCPYFSNVD